MTQFQWADGFHPPKDVPPEAVKSALDELPEISPENLLHASKAKDHVLHEDLWSEGDQVWAQRARLDRCRKIIGAVHEVIVVGGKEITVRHAEFVRTNGEGSWHTIDDITSDSALLEAYMREIQKLNEQATGKMQRLRNVMNPPSEK